MYSITYAGIISMIALPLLVQFGFSDQCGGEIADKLAMIPGALIAFYGRYRQGGITLAGVRTR